MMSENKTKLSTLSTKYVGMFPILCTENHDETQRVTHNQDMGLISHFQYFFHQVLLCVCLCLDLLFDSF